MRIHSQKGVFMNWIKSERFLRYSEGRAVVLAYIEMDSSADLPAVNTFTGRIISIGSYAHDIESGETYCLNSLNEWIKQKSGEVRDQAAEAGRIVLVGRGGVIWQ